MQFIKKHKKVSIVLALITFFYLFYITLMIFAFPPLANSIVQKQVPLLINREIEIEQISFNPFTLSLSINSLSLYKDERKPIVSWDTLLVNLQFSTLFKRALVFKEIRLVGAETSIAFMGNNQFNFSDMLKPKSEEQPKDSVKGGIPSLYIDQLSIVNAAFILDMEEEGKPVQNLITLDSISFSIEKFATNLEREDDNHYTVLLHTPEGAEIRWDGMVELTPFTSDGVLSLHNLDIANYLHPVNEYLPFELRKSTIGAIINYGISFDSIPLIKIDSSSFSLDSVEIFDPLQKKRVISIPSTKISGITTHYNLESGSLSVLLDSIGIHGQSLYTHLDKNGNLNLQRFSDFSILKEKVASFLETPGSTDSSMADTIVVDTLLEETLSIDTLNTDTASLDSTTVSTPLDLSWQLRTFTLRYDTLVFDDATYRKVVRQQVTNLDITVNSLSSQVKDSLAYSIKSTINTDGNITINGTGSIFPLDLKNQLTLEYLSFLPAQPYIDQLSYLKIRRGYAQAALEIEVAADSGGLSKLKVTGTSAIKQLSIIDTRNHADIIKFSTLSFNRIRANLLTNRFRLSSIGLYNPTLKIKLNKEGKINVLNLMKTKSSDFAQAQKQMKAAQASKKKRVLPNLYINSVRIKNAQVDLSDISPLFDFTSQISSFSGTIRKVSTFPNTPVLFDFTGLFSHTANVTIEGSVQPLLKKPSLTLNLTTIGVSLPDFTPYSATYTGLKIDKGEVATSFHYVIQNDSVIGNNTVVISNMEFGEKVESEDAIKLPYKLGLSLLKNREGNIEILIPVEGSLANPEFKVKKALLKALKQMLVNAVASPFKALAKLVGGGDDMDKLVFEAGQSTLDTLSQARLVKISEALTLKPELQVEIRGHYQDKDIAILKEEKLQQAIMQKLLLTVPLASLDSVQWSKKILAYHNQDSLILRAKDSIILENDKISPIQAEQILAKSLYKDYLNTTSMTISEKEQLGKKRARVVQGYLIDSLQVDPVRLHILQPEAGPDKESDVSLTLSVK